MAEELRKQPVLHEHDSTLGTVFRRAGRNKNSIRHDRRISVYLVCRERGSPPIQLILFGGCSPPKTHTSIAAFEASQFPQLRGLFISILLKRPKNTDFHSRNPSLVINFRFANDGSHVFRGTSTCYFWPICRFWLLPYEECSGTCRRAMQSAARLC